MLQKAPPAFGMHLLLHAFDDDGIDFFIGAGKRIARRHPDEHERQQINHRKNERQLQHANGDESTHESADHLNRFIHFHRTNIERQPFDLPIAEDIRVDIRKQRKDRRFVQ